MKHLAAVLAVLLLGGLVFAAGCIGTTPSEPIQAGDNVTVEFTMYIGDTVMVTSNETKYREILDAGRMPVPIILTENVVVTAGNTTDDDYMTLNSKTHKSPYWLLVGEYNVIAANIVGMNKGDTIRMPIYAAGTDMISVWTNEDCENMGIDKNDLKAGQRLTYTRSISEADIAEDGTFNPDNTTNEQTMIRDMLVTNITPDGIEYQEIYDTIEITIV
ncbi:hypothetical protein [Methanorbis furvi]|uniref:Uncharacterized protein n=1 Tax=Methanorbis furvi TaxID=3028299 RepID=A0AAE4MBJ5_9EURY|nr:hypothetical protein [Methanocorpusculaceae archaeon Ag1]